MFRTQVYLTSIEKENLALLAKKTGVHQSALIREAIDQFIESKKLEKRKKASVLKSAAGIWANRSDLPEVGSLRKELEREF